MVKKVFTRTVVAVLICSMLAIWAPLGMKSVAKAMAQICCLSMESTDVDSVDWLVYPTPDFDLQDTSIGYYYGDESSYFYGNAYINYSGDYNGFTTFQAVDGHWGVQEDVSGKIILDPVYDAPIYFSKDGYAVVYQNGSYGLVDETGAIVIPIMYAWMQNYSDGLIPVGLGYPTEYGYINLTSCAI